MLAAGLVLQNVGCREICKNRDIILATEDRDAAIGNFIAFVQRLGRLGIHFTTFTWEVPNFSRKPKTKKKKF